jgi:NAD(P)-dependent dehydrogenase (short-subunit alcohol dehydrogenase family)
MDDSTKTNTAGVQPPAIETADASGEDFDRVNAINLRGVWYCMKYELRQMREQGSGAVVLRSVTSSPYHKNLSAGLNNHAKKEQRND